jgi:hypothetical protein
VLPYLGLFTLKMKRQGGDEADTNGLTETLAMRRRHKHKDYDDDDGKNGGAGGSKQGPTTAPTKGGDTGERAW